MEDPKKKSQGRKRRREQAKRAAKNAEGATGSQEEAGASDNLKTNEEVAAELNLPEAASTIEDSRLPSCFAECFRNSRGTLTTPTAIQSVTWPAVLEGHDVLGIAPTGSGKSIAYLLPGLAHVLDKQTRAKKSKERRSTRHNSPSVFTLLPTRELAKQVESTARRFCKPYMISCMAAYGGKDRKEQVDTLQSTNIELVFATPGRALDLVRANDLSLECTTMLVLDECDRMLDMGFEPQIREFVAALREYQNSPQSILLSATFPPKLQLVLEDLKLLKKQPLRFRIGANGKFMPVENAEDQEDAGIAGAAGDGSATEQEKAAASALAAHGISSSITQIVQVVAEHKKPMKLNKFLDKVEAEDKEQNRLRNPSSVLIFCTKIKTVKFVETLIRKHPKRKCVALHGNLTQVERERSLRDFKAGKARILVATDVAGRGIDIKGLPFVVNYDFPGSLEVYVHRVGRTGRQDRPGVAYSFFTRNLAPLAPSLIALLQQCNQKVDQYLQRLVDQGEDDPDLKKIRQHRDNKRRKFEAKAAKEEGGDE
mmetsp:Transcript_11339/g.22125  ORF Transcript_11339/g.22125 Transcript_11339/m.22125 type:complete len:540 (-) Transcript_11339:1118-2737(-)